MAPPSSGQTEDSKSSAPAEDSRQSSFFESLQNKWHQISDSQRISRLQQCQELRDILVECRLRHRVPPPEIEAGRKGRVKDLQNQPSLPNDATSGAQERPLDAIETTPAGIRMLRYFHWRNLDPLPHRARETCAREEHALWACRAVATACGPDLVAVKKCFDASGPAEILGHSPAYEDDNEGEAGESNSRSGSPRSSLATSIKSRPVGSSSLALTAQQPPPPCAAVQRTMGKCVVEGVRDINSRVEERKSQT